MATVAFHGKNEALEYIILASNSQGILPVSVLDYPTRESQSFQRNYRKATMAQVHWQKGLILACDPGLSVIAAAIPEEFNNQRMNEIAALVRSILTGYALPEDQDGFKAQLKSGNSIYLKIAAAAFSDAYGPKASFLAATSNPLALYQIGQDGIAKRVFAASIGLDKAKHNEQPTAPLDWEGNKAIIEAINLLGESPIGSRKVIILSNGFDYKFQVPQ